MYILYVLCEFAQSVLFLNVVFTLSYLFEARISWNVIGFNTLIMRLRLGNMERKGNIHVKGMPCHRMSFNILIHH